MQNALAGGSVTQQRLYRQRRIRVFIVSLLVRMLWCSGPEKTVTPGA